MGNPGVIHVGAHFYQAARSLCCAVTFLNLEEAYAGAAPLKKLNWCLRGHRPTRLREFSQRVFHACRESRPCWLLSTGIAPITPEALEAVSALGVERLNFLTDDPWNAHHKAPWFMQALRRYDHVFSPRSANIADLRKLGCSKISHLRFAYAPEIHFPDPPANSEEKVQFASDVVFAGGADSDRLPYFAALIKAGFHVALYGGYWDRYSETRRYAMGHANPQALRRAIGGSKVALCLVRRANRDGHSMRTFELAAMGACMLVEDTDEHREILGQDGEAVIYFKTIPEMVQRLRWLLDRPEERHRLAAAAQSRITNGQNAYHDRLASMLGLTEHKTTRVSEWPSYASFANQVK